MKVNGNTSSAFPGLTGSNGKRGVITYFYDSTFSYTGIQKEIKFDFEGNLVTISNTTITGENPEIGDYIIYSEENRTTSFIITEIISAEEYTCYVGVSQIGQWINDNISQEDQQENITNINISCVNKNIQIRKLTDRIIFPKISKKVNSVNARQKIEMVESNAVKNFNIVALGNTFLGDYKIEIEFISDNISPQMHTIIANRFKYKDINLVSNQTSEKYIDTTCTYRGYLYNYDRKNKDPKFRSNFDNERLDNFTMIIKDYSDGVGEKSFNKDVCIPVEIFKDEKVNYRCFAFIYTNNNDGTFTKRFIQEINTADLINTENSLITND